MSTTDTALWGQWKRTRNADAFAELVQRHSGMVFATCRRIVGDTTLAEDVTQECFLELLRSQARVRTSLGALLHTIATRRSIDRVKGEVRRRHRERAFADDQTSSPTAQKDLELDEILAQVDAAISELPEPMHAAIVGRFLEGHKHAVLADSLGVAESTVRYRVEKGIEQIRDSLKRRGIALSALALTAALSRAAEAAPPALMARLSKLGLSASASAGGALSIVTAGFLLKTAVVVCATVGIVAAWWAVSTGPESAGELAEKTVVASAPAETVEQGPVADDAPVATESDTGGTAPDTEQTSAAAVPAVEDVSITGRVYDQATGQGIAGVKLHAAPSGGGTVLGWSEPADAHGHYAIPKLEDGSYSVRVYETPSGYPHLPGGGPSQHVVVQGGQTVSGVDFALKHGLLVAGHVLDTEGRPVSNATVGAKSLTVVNPLRCETGVEGRFRLFMPEPTDNLMIQAATDQAESEMLQGLTLTESGLDGIELVLDRPKTAVIAGVVITGDRSPLVRKQVLVYRKTPSVFTYGPNTNTGEDGRFRIGGLAADEYALIVPTRGIGGFSASEEYLRVMLQEGEVLEGIEIVFGERGGAAIAGRVVDASGNPIPDADIIYYGDRMIAVSTKRDGTFRLTGLPEGALCGIRVEHYKYTDTDASFPAGTEDALIVMKGVGTIELSVTDAQTGNALTGFRVASHAGRINDVSNIPIPSGGLVDTPDGTFQKGRLPEGPFTVIVWKEGYAMAWQTAEIEADRTANLTFVLEKAKSRGYAGRVVNSARQPVGEAYLYFTRPHSVANIPGIALKQTDAEGHFTIDFLPDGVEYLYAYKGGYGIGAMHLHSEREIVLPTPGVLEGIVKAPGRPVPNMNIWVSHPEEDWRYPSHTVTATADGTFRLAGLTPGLWMASANSFGESPLRLTKRAVEIVSGQTTPVVLTLMDGSASVEGTVMCDGQAAGLVRLELEQLGHDDIVSQTIQLHPHMNGTYRFDNVCAGTFVLRARRYSEAPGPQTYEDEVFFDVAEGAQVVVNMDLPPLPE